MWIQTDSRVPLSSVRIPPCGTGIKSPWHPVALASHLRGPCPSRLWHLQPELHVHDIESEQPEESWHN